MCLAGCSPLLWALHVVAGDTTLHYNTPVSPKVPSLYLVIFSWVHVFLGQLIVSLSYRHHPPPGRTVKICKMWSGRLPRTQRCESLVATFTVLYNCIDYVEVASFNNFVSFTVCGRARHNRLEETHLTAVDFASSSSLISCTFLHYNLKDFSKFLSL